MSAGPRWTTGKFTYVKPPQKDGEEGSTTSARAGTTTRANATGFRETWMQQKSREFLWVPGPGTYKSEREFMLPDSHDEVDTNKTVQECAPDYSFGRELKETALHMKNNGFTNTKGKSSKFMRNHGSYPKNDDSFTPGP